MYQLSLRYIVLVVLGLCLVFCSPSSAMPQEGPSVRLDPSTLYLEEGETGEVSVCVRGVTDLAGAEFHITFDAEAVEVVDAEPSTAGIQIAHGGFLPADFVVQNQVDSSAGTIDYAVARMPPNDPVSGDGCLAIISLRAKDGGGNAALRLESVLLADPDGLPIEPIIVSSDPTPEPGPVSEQGSSGCASAPIVVVGAVALYFLPRRRGVIRQI